MITLITSKRVTNQSSPSPVREISDHLTFQFLPVVVDRITPAPESLHELLGNLEKLSDFLLSSFLQVVLKRSINNTYILEIHWSSFSYGFTNVLPWQQYW